VSGHATADGGFLSDDGTVYVDSNGGVEHGRTTAGGVFETPRVVDGQTLWGTSTTGGGWISEDRKTYVDSSGTVEHGITAPDGTFVPNGTTRTLPDGTTLYGNDVGGSFYSYDGSTIVLGDGTVVHGHLDQGTGIFTADNGATYGVTGDGIFSGTVQPDDGSLLLGNGQTLMTPAAWAVDLAKMADAIATVKTKAGSIDDHISTITGEYANVGYRWSSPAGQTFSDVTTKATAAMKDMQNMLSDMISRMQLTHDNYETTENVNTQNNKNYS
jgi:WXG100 family type VII secretion target